MILMTRRDAVLDDAPGLRLPPLLPETLEAARVLRPGADVYALEADWHAWWAQTGRLQVRNADRAFLGFVKKGVAR
jgi:hypothetical protein